MTRLSTGLAAACQLKREGPVEMKELFTRAPWERDLKKSVTAGSRGTGDAGCVLASYRYVPERWLHGNDADASRCLDTTKASAPRGLWEEEAMDLGRTGCSGASLCAAFRLPRSRQQGRLVCG